MEQAIRNKAPITRYRFIYLFILSSSLLPLFLCNTHMRICKQETNSRILSKTKREKKKHLIKSGANLPVILSISGHLIYAKLLHFEKLKSRLTKLLLDLAIMLLVIEQSIPLFDPNFRFETRLSTKPIRQQVMDRTHELWFICQLFHSFYLEWSQMSSTELYWTPERTILDFFKPSISV